MIKKQYWNQFKKKIEDKDNSQEIIKDDVEPVLESIQEKTESTDKGNQIKTNEETPY